MAAGIARCIATDQIPIAIGMHGWDGRVLTCEAMPADLVPLPPAPPLPPVPLVLPPPPPQPAVLAPSPLPDWLQRYKEASEKRWNGLDADDDVESSDVPSDSYGGATSPEDTPATLPASSPADSDDDTPSPSPSTRGVREPSDDGEAEPADDDHYVRSDNEKSDAAEIEDADNGKSGKHGHAAGYRKGSKEHKSSHKRSWGSDDDGDTKGGYGDSLAGGAYGYGTYGDDDDSDANSNMGSDETHKRYREERKRRDRRARPDDPPRMRDGDKHDDDEEHDEAEVAPQHCSDCDDPEPPVEAPVIVEVRVALRCRTGCAAGLCSARF